MAERTVPKRRGLVVGRKKKSGGRRSVGGRYCPARKWVSVRLHLRHESGSATAGAPWKSWGELGRAGVLSPTDC
jgi:hypothetical protein